MIRYLFALLLCLPSFAADTGWVLAGAGATVSDGHVAWSSPGNITAEDGTNATCNVDTGGQSDILKGTTFPTTIPAGATINGVEVKLKLSVSAIKHRDFLVKLVVGGTIVGANRATAANLPTSPATWTYGSSTDMWSTTITRDQAIATNFGWVFQTDDNDSGAEQSRVDSMYVKIYYTEAGAAPAGGFPLMFLETE